MALDTRTLTNSGSPLYNPGGVVVSSGTIKFTLVDKNNDPVDVWDATTFERIAGPVNASIDSNGEFSVDLWPNSRGNHTTYYLCEIVGSNDFEKFKGQIPDGDTDLQWIDFYAGGETLEGNDVDLLSIHQGLVNAHGRSITASVTYTVGSGGDYATLNAALADLSYKRPIYSTAGVGVTLNILSGTTISEQILARNVDLSWITITSVDATVTVTRSALTEKFALSGTPAYYPFIGGANAKLPKISTYFIFDSSGTSTTKVALYVDGPGSSIVIDENCGVSGESSQLSLGLYAINGANVSAAGGIIKDFITANITAASNSRVTASSATLTGATSYGVRALSGAYLYIFGSNCQKGASPDLGDIVVTSGGIISAAFSTGGVSQTANTITSEGIIFK